MSTGLVNQNRVARYFDASCLVKLVDEDPSESAGRDALRRYYHQNPNVYATSHSITEALAMLKGKYGRKQSTGDLYLGYVSQFLRVVVGCGLQTDDDISILNPSVFDQTERLFAKHRIDFLDCLQIVTILRGRFRHAYGDSQALLITADKPLATAAREEGIEVWECTSEPMPS